MGCSQPKQGLSSYTMPGQSQNQEFPSWVWQMGDTIWGIFHSFPDTLADSWNKRKQRSQDSNGTPIKAAGIPSRGFNNHATNTCSFF